MHERGLYTGEKPIEKERKIFPKTGGVHDQCISRSLYYRACRIANIQRNQDNTGVKDKRKEAECTDVHEEKKTRATASSA